MALIKFDNVSKVYEEGGDVVRAMDGVSFEIKEGDFAAIMGPSGSGKSTLLSVLGVLNTPTGGKVLIDEIPVYELKSEKQADFRFEYLGFIFQAFQLIPYLTAIENVMLPLSITKASNIEQEKRSREVLEMVGLGDKINRLPDQLSGGEIQRIAVARAIVNEPPIILADEPTGNLDSKNAVGVIELLKKLKDRGKTVIMVTHDLSIAKHADYIIQIKDGKILT